MAKLTDEQAKQLKELQELAEAPDEQSNGPSRVENINLTVDLNNPDQVKRAVRAGYLPASYLEDDEEPEEEEAEEESPARRLKY